MDLSNYATEDDLKGVTGVDTPKLAMKSELAGLKVQPDKLDVDKMKNIPTDLSNVISNDVVKKRAW